MVDDFGDKEKSRGRILTLLRGGALTVNELAEALELTDNGVRAHLVSLQSEGLVEIAGQRAGLRKPHTLFGLTGAGRARFPTAEGPLLKAVLDGLEGTMSSKALSAFLLRVGREMAEGHRAEFEGAPIEKRRMVAMRILGEIGGVAELREEKGLVVIQGKHCPLANLVPEHPEVCAVAEGLLERILGVGVREVCEKGEKPCCRFELAA
jgi:predicted ArsR family transcriptional regulator